MEKECCNCGKLHEQNGFPAWKKEEIFEGKKYEWFYCSIECTFEYSEKDGDEILKNINKVKMKKLNNFLEATKSRLDNPKFKI